MKVEEKSQKKMVERYVSESNEGSQDSDDENDGG